MKNKSIAVSYCINIPEDATNGNVIKALFPDARVDDYDYGKDPVIDVYGIDDTEYITFRKNWWNAPYKPESKEQDDKPYVRIGEEIYYF